MADDESEDFNAFIDGDEPVEEPKGEKQPDPAPPAEGANEAAEQVEEQPAAADEAAPDRTETREVQGFLKATLDEREKRQAAERKAEEAERRANEAMERIAQFERAEAQRRRPPPQPIDPVTDPERFAAVMEHRLQSAQHAQRVELSKAFAIRDHGEETVQAATNALADAVQKYGPNFAQQFATQPDPVGAMVGWYKREEALRDFSDDPEAYKAKVIEEYLASQTAEAGTPEPARDANGQFAAKNKPTRAIPKSMAKQIGTEKPGSQGTVSDEEEFASIFQR